MSNINQAIGVFDSGIGGLSILDSIQQVLAAENFIYLADHEFAPYGEKPDEQVIERCEHIIEYFLSRHCKAIVIACNTATAIAVETLREITEIPIIGIEPAVKPAVLLNRSGHVGVLATEATLRSQRYRELVQMYGKDVVFHNVAGNGLTELIEHNFINSKRCKQLLDSYLQPMIEEGCDTLILGCTHYPYLIPVIRQYYPEIRQILDPASAVARRLKEVLEHAEILRDGGEGKQEYLTTGDTEMLNRIVPRLTDKDIQFQKTALPAFTGIAEASA